MFKIQVKIVTAVIPSSFVISLLFWNDRTIMERKKAIASYRFVDISFILCRFIISEWCLNDWNEGKMKDFLNQGITLNL